MKFNKIKQFILLLIINFSFLALGVFFINSNFISQPSTLFIFNRPVVDLPILIEKIPLIFYLVLFVLIYSFLTFLYLSFKERKKIKKIEDALKMLNAGQYSAVIFLKMFSEESPVQINPLIDKEFLKLQEKMILISEEAVSSAQQISQITKESREEIIELERQRIARELHDSVSQQLFAAAMLLSAIQLEGKKLEEEISEQINLVSSIIDEAQSEMRALLLHLRPVKLDGKSLKKGIENLLEELGSKVPIEINHDIDDVKLAEVVENHLFRIIQELLSNVLRHAEANELEVYLKKTEDFYRLRFIDDGKGFDIDQKKDSALGLSNIRERIERLGGNFQLVSFPDQGTSVEIRIPIITRRII